MRTRFARGYVVKEHSVRSDLPTALENQRDELHCDLSNALKVLTKLSGFVSNSDFGISKLESPQAESSRCTDIGTLAGRDCIALLVISTVGALRAS